MPWPTRRPDRTDIRKIELDFFQGRSDEAISGALEALGSLDADDDDDADAISSILSKGLSSTAAERFASALVDAGFDCSVRFPDGTGVANLYASAGRSDPVVFSKLMGMGADPYSTDRSGRNYLHTMAAMEKSPWIGQREDQLAEIASLGDASMWMTADAYGATPLHLAVLMGHSKLASRLLEMGADPDAAGTGVREGFGHSIDFDGATALDMAALMGDSEAAGLLISKGADASVRDVHGRDAAHYCVTRPPQSLCREYETVPGRDAVNARKREVLSMLKDVDSTDDSGATPLLSVLTSNRYDDGGFTALLLEKGADPNRASNNGTTPLMAAASNGHRDAAKALLAAGADPDARGPGGATALHMAVQWRDEKIARLLIKKGAAYDLPDDSGRTAAEEAASAGMESVLELMV